MLPVGSASTAADRANNPSTIAFFSSQARSKPFPPNLKVDPRSSFAPVNKNESAPASIRVEEKEEDEVDETREEGAEASAAEEEDDDDDDEDDDDDDDDWVYEPIEKTAVMPLPDRLHQSIYNFGPPSNENNNDNSPEEVGTIWLNASIFGKDPIRIDLMKRAVDYHRAKKRGRRKARTKRIGDIRGSTKKVRPQKGQGMARAGHRFPGHWRGGAKAHGPTNETNYGNTKLNKKVRRQAVQNVLSQKVKEGNLILVNQFHNLPSHKTKTLTQWLQPFGIAGRHGTSALMLDSYFPKRRDEADGEDTPEATSYNGIPTNLWVASGNHFKLTVGNQLRNLNVYDALKHEKLILTLGALKALEERLSDE